MNSYKLRSYDVFLDGVITYFPFPKFALALLFGLYVKRFKSLFKLLPSIVFGYSSDETSAKNYLYGPPSPTTCSPLNTMWNDKCGSAPYGFLGLN